MTAPRRRLPRLLLCAAVLCGVLPTFAASQRQPDPQRGLTHAPTLAAAYDAVLDADFGAMPQRLEPACRDVPVHCDAMRAVSTLWQITIDETTRRYDDAFSAAAARAIAGAERWVTQEPRRAEAWFARGAAYSARAQWRVLRKERLAATRDGKQIKESLEQALAIDPDLHDAKFGVGMYRYYADVAPAALRVLRFLLLLPGGDREGGLQQMLDARAHGQVMRGEADYQLHLIYLWYENRAADALALLRSLQARYPRNPHFALAEADVHAVYFHDRRASEAVLRALIARADASQINAADVARRRARAALVALHARSPR